MALKKVGALWVKEDKNKKKYLAGNLDLGAMGAMGTISVMVFEAEKKAENSPEYKIYLTDDK